jgi:FkbM family methyltransferase
MHTLRPQLMRLLESGAAEPDNDDLAVRPVVLLAPNSHLGRMFVPGVVAKLPNAVAVVDDYSTEASICGLPRWTTFEFASRAPALANPLALDFSVGHFSAAMFRAMCAQAGVECRDFVAAHGQFGLPSVFETAREYRANTLARIDDFLKLETRLADQASRETLYGMLLFRLTYDRQRARDIMFGSAEEYFADSASGKTFVLGEKEFFVDCGAHQGTIVARFLGASGWKFDGIAAFEPDRKNFRQLQKYCLLPIPNLKLVNKALSDRHETLRFVETGTMSSYVSDAGNISVETTRLDDELDRMTFLKMDIEGFESRTLEGGATLIARHRPRMAIAAYHYATDMLDIVDTIDRLVDGYHIRLRQHFNYYYDSIIYASPAAGWECP